jgi:hypothetical protein
MRPRDIFVFFSDENKSHTVLTTKLSSARLLLRLLKLDIDGPEKYVYFK